MPKETSWTQRGASLCSPAGYMPRVATGSGTGQSSVVSEIFFTMDDEPSHARLSCMSRVTAYVRQGWTRAGSPWTASTTSKPVAALNSVDHEYLENRQKSHGSSWSGQV